ncbi:hypothetical protein SUGI_0879530 [Cryptomeria japonica]|uniref:taxoid 14-beta-hydroxylase-like n=1 Tax=Cryptomeria japonica TaxID=3369 RepID=UPI002414BD1A|nr:taxoid 14-beta-hydroxylase-like [Cryptomeria japonica]GLJ42444.1 hypothetical protein SUGI_0879530 [Cryptomeria japonica]
MGLWDMFPTWLPIEVLCIFMAAAAMVYIVLGSVIVYGPLLLSALRLKLTGNMPPLPPGRMGLPYWGESVDYIKSCSDPHNPDMWYDRRKAEHGPIFKTHILGSPTVVILGHQANKFILINENKLFLNSWPKSVRVLVGENAMVTSHGARHKRLRQIILSVLGQHTLRMAIGKFERLVVQHLQSEWHAGSIVRAHEKLMDMTDPVCGC